MLYEILSFLDPNSCKNVSSLCPEFDIVLKCIFQDKLVLLYEDKSIVRPRTGHRFVSYGDGYTMIYSTEKNKSEKDKYPIFVSNSDLKKNIFLASDSVHPIGGGCVICVMDIEIFQRHGIHNHSFIFRVDEKKELLHGVEITLGRHTKYFYYRHNIPKIYSAEFPDERIPFGILNEETNITFFPEDFTLNVLIGDKLQVYSAEYKQN